MPTGSARVALGASLIPAGQLRFTREGPRQHSTYSYDPAWTNDARGFALEPGLPLDGGQFHAARKGNLARDALLSIFSDAAPDSWGRRRLQRAYGAGLSEFEYLTLSDDQSRKCALRFLGEDGEVIKGSAAAIPRLVDLDLRPAEAQRNIV